MKGIDTGRKTVKPPLGVLQLIVAIKCLRHIPRKVNPCTFQSPGSPQPAGISRQIRFVDEFMFAKFAAQ